VTFSAVVIVPAGAPIRLRHRCRNWLRISSDFGHCASSAVPQSRATCASAPATSAALSGKSPME